MTSELLWGLGGLVAGSTIGFLLGRFRPRRNEWNQAVGPLISALAQAEPRVARGEMLELESTQLEAFRQIASRGDYYKFNSGVEYVNQQLATAQAVHHDRQQQQALLNSACLSLATLQNRVRRR
ncbi:hypothetical protein [Cobetia crustatorum]|uniref:hypothetical protein n=1 Tax=Cobetia crustatorum TaxID=553385 RepID=UPI00046917C3|nr:hypothetical protein [Cobetia crustatorum]